MDSYLRRLSIELWYYGFVKEFKNCKSMFVIIEGLYDGGILIKPFFDNLKSK